MSHLHNGQTFPDLSVPAVGGGTLSLPSDLAGSFGIVLIYRGSWCPYCMAQLASFSRATEKLAAVNAKVVAISVDDEETGAGVIEKHKLAFPVGHSAPADAVSALTGASTNDDPHYLQSTGFVLGPEGEVLTAVYSTGAIGRLTADDTIGFLQYLSSHA